jgi:hypothetical protein
VKGGCLPERVAAGEGVKPPGRARDAQSWGGWARRREGTRKASQGGSQAGREPGRDGAGEGGHKGGTVQGRAREGRRVQGRVFAPSLPPWPSLTPLEREGGHEGRPGGERAKEGESRGGKSLGREGTGEGQGGIWGGREGMGERGRAGALVHAYCVHGGDRGKWQGVVRGAEGEHAGTRGWHAGEVGRWWGRARVEGAG